MSTEALFHAEVSVVSDLYQAGYKCDGHPFIGEVYFVQLDFPNGQRFRHFQSWKGVEVVRDEEGEQHFQDARPQAEAAAERLRSRIQAAHVWDTQYWTECDPAYGSYAYQSQGIELERWAAERAAG
jgi:hypothetical protein